MPLTVRMLQKNGLENFISASKFQLPGASGLVKNQAAYPPKMWGGHLAFEGFAPTLKPGLCCLVCYGRVSVMKIGSGLKTFCGYYATHKFGLCTATVECNVNCVVFNDWRLDNV